MVELVYTRDLKSLDHNGHAGSTPAPSTQRREKMINKPVYQVWSNTLRFWIVAEERMEGHWKQYRVEWVMDEAYEQVKEEDPNHEWHRCDHLVFYDPQQLLLKVGLAKRRGELKNLGHDPDAWK